MSSISDSGFELRYWYPIAWSHLKCDQVNSGFKIHTLFRTAEKDYSEKHVVIGFQ